jgi:hypothetical protein
LCFDSATEAPLGDARVAVSAKSGAYGRIMTTTSHSADLVSREWWPAAAVVAAAAGYAAMAIFVFADGPRWSDLVVAVLTAPNLIWAAVALSLILGYTSVHWIATAWLFAILAFVISGGLVSVRYLVRR